ncbi:baseplate J/gp47 family protein [Streptomyces sp. CB03238]|uniref:baseplate J/gp47 family protein n=1 Tax=Streptomyces sp. CB03238 TaxID=1907777 RepID=UPI00117CACFF|nr:baseplate J/gp47 family protein [Streptomyces sp. CB03238]
MADLTSSSPAIDYTSKDFEGFRQAMLAHAARVYPEWSGRNTADFGVLLVNLFAYMGDILSYYQDAAAREAFLETATLRSSVLAHAATLGYSPASAAPSTGTVTFLTETSQPTDVILPAGTQVTTAFIPAIDAPLTFELDEDVTVPARGGSITARVTEGATAGTQPLTLNTGTGTETIVLVDSLGTSSGTENQSFTLPSSPALVDSVRVFVGADAPVEWHATSDMLTAAPTDQVFKLTVSDSGTVTITFGDGTLGAIPNLDLPIYASYRVGGGERGNIDANQVIDISQGVAGVFIASSSAMTGGREIESTESIRANAPKAYRTQDRAVTLRDFEDLALAVPGNAKAKATGNHHSSITISIIGADNATPSDDQITATVRYIQDRTLTGVYVHVAPGTLVGVNLGSSASPVVLGIYPNFRASEVVLAAQKAIQDLLSSQRSSFGQRIPASRIYALFDAIPGVEYVNIPLLARADGPQNGTQDIICRDWEIPVAGQIFITADGGQ